MAAAPPAVGTVPLQPEAHFFPRPMHAPPGLPGPRHVVPVYMHPSPPYLPCQFPVPMHIPCSPHFGLPTMGLGMAMLPMPPNPYMEVPGYVLHSSQLPLPDFRQVMDPSLFMNLHPPRFRRPNPASVQVVSSGVQTELPATAECVTNSEMGSDSGRGTGHAASGSPLTSPGYPPQTSVYSLSDSPDSPDLPGYVTQENIRRGCGEILPKGGLYQKGSTSADTVQGNCGPADGAIFTYRPPLHSSSHCTDADVGAREVPDILVREASQSPSSGGHGKQGAIEPNLNPMLVNISSVWEKNEAEQMSDPEDGMFKIVRLPFDGQFVAAWRGMADQSVWSVESVPSLVPSAQWLARHGLASDRNGAAEAEALVRSKPGGDASLKVAVAGEHQRLSTSSSDSLPPYVPAASWLSEFRHVHCCGRLIPCTGECRVASRGPRERS